MSDVPPPAYSAVNSGENVPPSYNEQAPTAPPSYNPSAPVSQPVSSQPTVKYVDQNGNPVNPPPTATTGTTAGVVVAPGAAANARPVTRSIKQQKTASFFLGGIALLILFIGMCVDSLASGTSYFSYDVTTTCGWTELSVDCGDSYSYYSSSCTDASMSYGDFCDQENQYDVDVSPSWCGTQASASISLVTMLIATIMCGIGVIFVQPWCPITACCCKTNPNCGCARVSFIFSLCFGILTLVIWLAGDEICLGSG
eukprot:463390_1